ncbi:Ornithine carbamoyltransferase protein [Marine Group I thaumarchaeote SCGC RSA3]|uniref:Ornithine carbamoyltransferase n=4 Tax=Marine Group I TaxID=905826 RepID=A0A081RP64_9ARCH|nr:Ornithine carbamoyltransferase protein [Marine Group I thaumarchaeote SCGC AAA799-N04]KFM17024.1 Ornithine carbamoyltransferase protein [Marine Group I thaumarchaeote SCGC AAA799-D11]KFM19125.1 Ornithine carbamoyltransferase protein [Marine Group I thaumarchaeote SCGC RSA3]
MKLKTKNLLTLAELSPKEFVGLINESIKLKKELNKGGNKPVLKNKTLTMIFQKPSTRTRVSFEIGMSQLGGYAVNLSSNDMQLSRGESVEDTAKTLSRYTDCIMARVYDHELLEQLSKNATIPIINGLSDTFHPCQILADFMTIKEKKKKIKGIKIAWIGDGNNVCNSMIYGAALSGATMSIATPKGFEPDKKAVKDAKKSTNIELTSDPLEAVKGADVVVTDTYSSIHNDDPKRIKKFLPKYQVNDKLMKSAKKDAIFMHCLPAKRDQEVTSSVIDGPQSVVWDEAENRLHSQKALLASLIRA